MKYKINTDEGEKIFLYEIFDGNIYVTQSQFQIGRNIKRLGITNDFTKNTRISMIYDINKEENIVIFTYNEKETNEKVQTLIDGNSRLEDVPDELKSALEPAFKVKEQRNLMDLLNLNI